MRSRTIAFVGVKEGLVQFFARAQTGIDDGDVASGLLAGEPDHLLGEQADRHRFAHIEGVDRLLGTDRRGLQNQLAGFRNGHEEPGDFGIGDRHRATAADLLAEQRYDAAGGIEHVAEAHGDEAGGTRIGERLAQHLGQAFGRAEHVHRIDRLVRRDQHESADTGCRTRPGNRFGGQYVVADRFAQLRFQQRHLFVCGGMEDRIRFHQIQRVADHRRVAAVAQHRRQFDSREVATQPHLGGGQRQFVDLDQRDPACAVARALAAQFGTDGTACARDQHAAAAEPIAHRLPVRHHGRAAKQVLDRDFLEFAGQRAAFEDIVESRHHPERHAGAFAGFDHPPHLFGIDRRHGDDQQLGGGFRRDPADIVDPAKHRHAVQMAAAQFPGVVQKAYRLIGAGTTQVADQRLARLPRAQDQHAHRRLVAVDPTVILPRAIEQPRRAEHQSQHERIHHQHRARRLVESVVDEEYEEDGEQAEQARLQDIHEIGHAGEAPDTAIEANLPGHQTLSQQHQQGIGRPERRLRGGIEHGVPKLHKTGPAQPDDAQIVQHDHGARPRAGQTVLQCGGHAPNSPFAVCPADRRSQYQNPHPNISQADTSIEIPLCPSPPSQMAPAHASNVQTA